MFHGDRSQEFVVPKQVLYYSFMLPAPFWALLVMFMNICKFNYCVVKAFITKQIMSALDIYNLFGVPIP